MAVKRTNPVDILLNEPWAFRDKLLDRVQITNDGCWNWLYSKDKDGYGIYSFSYGYYKLTTVRAHRASYLVFKNCRIEGQLHHTCEVKRCVNPNHLIDTTAKVNSRLSKGWHQDSKGRWTCSMGHLILSDADMYTRSYNKSTQCKRCTIERASL